MPCTPDNRDVLCPYARCQEPGGYLPYDSEICINYAPFLSGFRSGLAMRASTSDDKKRVVFEFMAHLASQRPHVKGTGFLSQAELKSPNLKFILANMSIYQEFNQQLIEDLSQVKSRMISLAVSSRFSTAGTLPITGIFVPWTRCSFEILAKGKIRLNLFMHLRVVNIWQQSWA